MSLSRRGLLWGALVAPVVALFSGGAKGAPESAGRGSVPGGVWTNKEPIVFPPARDAMLWNPARAMTFTHAEVCDGTFELWCNGKRVELEPVDTESPTLGGLHS
jgi:hypothetical protein